MKVCPNCNAQLPDDSMFCSVCGASVPAASQYQQNGTNPYAGGYANPQMNPQMNPQYNPQMYPQMLPMGWYKFLIYFALFAGGLINLVSGIITMTGVTYRISGVEPSLVYSYYPGLKPLDMFYGIVLIALAIFVVYTRFALSGYKKIGPICLYAVYAANVVLILIYSIGTFSIVGNLDQLSNIPSLVVTVFFLVFNILYFKKRKHLFVN